MYIQQNFLEDLKYFFKSKSLLAKLIIINIAVFMLVAMVNLFTWLFQINTPPGISPVVYWFALPSNTTKLLLKPWTLFSYMFLQENFFHLFFNMLMLYFGGRIFSEYLNDKKLLNTYICGGIAGGLLFLLSYNIFPVFENTMPHAIALGASASVLAILVAIATYVPNYIVPLILLGRVKLKHLAIAFFVIDILSIKGGNPGGHIAHIGGALWGYLYIQLLKGGFDFSKLFRFQKINFSKKGPKKAYANPNLQQKKPLTDEEYNRQKAAKQKEIDAILEKISRSGYSSLTAKEKETLFKMSNDKEK